MNITEKITKKSSSRHHRHFFGLGREKDYIIENLSQLVGAGQDLLTSLKLLKTDIKSKAMKGVLNEIISDVENGSPLWQALKNSQLFPPYMVALVQIGEESGKLEENLKIVATEDERERSFSSQVESAMMYPVFVFAFTLVVGLGVAWFILPRLAIVFSSLRLELPYVTKILINFGSWLGANGTVAVPVIIFLGVLFIYLIFFFKPTKFLGQNFLFAMPVTKKLLQELELSRFGFLLGTLLSAGIPITSAINSLSEATFFPAYKKIYNRLNEKLHEGETIQNSLAKYPKSYKYFPATIQGMISAGEQAGSLPETLLKIGEIYSSKTESTSKNLTTLIEPVLLIIVWFAVMGVALAVFLPIYNLIGSIGK